MSAWATVASQSMILQENHKQRTVNMISLTLSELVRGERAVIESFSDDEVSLKLMEMGCIPGETIEVMRIAPLGDPIAILVAGYQLSLRKSEAGVINVRRV